MTAYDRYRVNIHFLFVYYYYKFCLFCLWPSESYRSGLSRRRWRLTVFKNIWTGRQRDVARVVEER